MHTSSPPCGITTCSSPSFDHSNYILGLRSVLLTIQTPSGIMDQTTRCHMPISAEEQQRDRLLPRHIRSRLVSLEASRS
jgi:hypothetical protein